MKQGMQPKQPRPFTFYLLWSGILVLLCVVALIVKSTAFRLEDVYVDGLSEHSARQVIEIAGLFRGQDMFALQEKTVAEAFKDDTMLVFTGMRKRYPSTLELFFEERNPVASLRSLGEYYVLDRIGNVLYQEKRGYRTPGLPLVTGLHISSINVGSRLHVQNEKQLEAYQKVMFELEMQNCSSQIKSVNFSDYNDISLESEKGVTVRLGDGEKMRAKIGSMRAGLAYLSGLGDKGELDVTTPDDVKYRPEG